MTTNEFDTITVTRTMPAPIGYKGNIIITAQAYRLGNNEHPHFSVTADMPTEHMGGCLHEEISQVWPQVRPIIALHLSNADDGAPMHVEANGFYWLAGAVGGLGEQYHGGSGTSAKSSEACLRMLADHLRISLADARKIAEQVNQEYAKGLTSEEPSNARIMAKNCFHDYVEQQRSTWEAEAKAGRELLRKLEQETRQ